MIGYRGRSAFLTLVALGFCAVSGSPPATAGDTQAVVMPVRFCPQYLTRLCVEEPDGRRHFAMTNPCFAGERHERVVPARLCR